LGGGTILDDKERIATATTDFITGVRLPLEQFTIKPRLGKSNVDQLHIRLFSEKTLAIIQIRTGLRRCPTVSSTLALCPSPVVDLEL
jgi:hypothetical protein